MEIVMKYDYIKEIVKGVPNDTKHQNNDPPPPQKNPINSDGVQLTLRWIHFRNFKIRMDLPSMLGTEMAQVIDILPCGRLWPINHKSVMKNLFLFWHDENIHVTVGPQPVLSHRIPCPQLSEMYLTSQANGKVGRTCSQRAMSKGADWESTLASPGMREMEAR